MGNNTLIKGILFWLFSGILTYHLNTEFSRRTKGSLIAKTTNVMKKSRVLLILLCFSIFFSSAQQKGIDHIPKYLGYEHSQTNGIVSKLVMHQSIKESNSGDLKNYLQKNTNVAFEYFDIVKSCMNIPLSQCNDSQGNTFITGSSGNLINHSGDITTVKINQSGMIVWTVRIPSPSFTVNAGTNIALDSDGNIILTGYIWGNDSMDLICAKISNNGEVLWQNIISNDLNFDIPTAIFVNSNNEVLVTGITHLDNVVTYFTAKFDAFGQLIWQHVEDDFPSSTWNEPKTVTQDNEGNILVSGYGYNLSDKSSIVTIKYSASGQFLWKRIKSYTVTLMDLSIVSTDAYPNDLVIDAQNNIYTTGTFKTEFASSSTTFKYDVNGVESWNYNYQVPNENTFAYTNLIDQNVLYVGGIHYGNSLDGYLLLSLNLDGTTNWEVTTEDLQSIFKFNMFKHNDAIVLNSVSYLDLSNTNNKINTTSFSTTGNQLSSSDYSINNELLGFSFGSFFDSYTYDNKYVHVFSSYYADLGNVYETILLDNTNSISSLLWSSKLQENNATSTNVLESLGDSDSNLYSLVSNFYIVNNQLNQKTYLIKYSDLGAIEWSELLDDSTNLVSARMKVDHNDDLIVLLGKPMDDGSTQITVKKISHTGVNLWNTTYTNNITGNFFPEITSENNFVVASTSMNIDGTTNIMVVTISESGVVLSTNIYQPTDAIYTQNFVSKLLIDGSGNIIIGGGSGFYNSELMQNIFSPSLLKIDTNGIMNYYNIYPVSGSSSFIVDIVTNNNGLTLAIDSSDLITSYNKIRLLSINESGIIAGQYFYQEANTNCYVYKVMKGVEDGVFYTAGSRLGEEQNIQVLKWNLNQNETNSFNLNGPNYYQDSFIDSQHIFILSQNQESLHFPRRNLNWIGPFISGKVTKLDYALVQSEEINLIGEHYSLYEPKQFIPLNNNSLVVSGRMFDEQFFYEGLSFFDMSFNPILSVPSYPEDMSYYLFYNYPNPINSNQTNVVFELKQNESVVFNLYDLNGKLIRNIHNGFYLLGINHITIQLPFLMDGTYILELNTSAQRLQKKIIVSKK